MDISATSSVKSPVVIGIRDEYAEARKITSPNRYPTAVTTTIATNTINGSFTCFQLNVINSFTERVFAPPKKIIQPV